MQRKYGDHVSFFLSKRLFIGLFSPAAVHEVTVAQQHSFVKGVGFARMRKVLGEGLLTNEEPIHLNHRRMMQPPFHHGNLDGYVSLMFDLVEKYMDSVRKIWNEQHDIKIKGYDVESFIQDVSHKGTPSGQFSILKNKWIIKPSLSNFKPDEDLIKTKASKIMNDIDDLGFDLEHTQNYEKISERFKKIWKRVKESRKSSLEKTGEFSVENLVFKLLRRNGYIGKLLDIRAKAYDYQFSID
jgi:hypothetical protein